MRTYQEALQVDAPAGTPVAFAWRKGKYVVNTVVSQWRERTDWWQSEPDRPLTADDLERCVWRVEARQHAGRAVGLFDLSHDPGGWTLNRAHD